MLAPEVHTVSESIIGQGDPAWTRELCTLLQYAMEDLAHKIMKSSSTVSTTEHTWPIAVIVSQLLVSQDPVSVPRRGIGLLV